MLKYIPPTVKTPKILGTQSPKTVEQIIKEIQELDPTISYIKALQLADKCYTYNRSIEEVLEEYYKQQEEIYKTL